MNLIFLRGVKKEIERSNTIAVKTESIEIDFRSRLMTRIRNAVSRAIENEILEILQTKKHQ